MGVKHTSPDHIGSCEPLQGFIYTFNWREKKKDLGREGTSHEEKLKGITECSLNDRPLGNKRKITEPSYKVVGIIQKKCDAL